ncbi:membrane fusion protein PrsE [Sphingomonas sp. YR710]|jgi:HlyD family secretion protein|uniref:HlyD family type I secretion periplasmic adaptor subunit n=1 Tax=Sphingomonas sp. YR710 TaxID=1882773 RepID=UPI00088FDA0F|nr:HlyD family type I secretion periplasmic adaptor subunit [Sphingomonas sp. YR710]SDD88764.1 membrane fusion protein PrsE [Sphingomonas sp. YR710]
MLEVIRKRSDRPEPEDVSASVLRQTGRQIDYTVGLLFLVLFALATFVRVGGAVVAPGSISVESSIKQISHPTGGVLAAIFVRDGSHVKAGQALMRLDSALSGITAAAAGGSYFRVLARRARLQAEIDGGSPIFSKELTTSADPDAKAAQQAELQLFAMRKQARRNQRSQLNERLNQIEQQNRASQAQIGDAEQQLRLIQPELVGMRELWSKKLTTIGRLNQLERTAVDISANKSGNEAALAQGRARMAEIRAQIIQIDQDLRSTSGAELAQVDVQLADQAVRRAMTQETFDRAVLHAPQSGFVDKLAFSTVGGVIPAGQTILQIVPDQDRLIVESAISPNDIDRVHIGQSARVQFTGFNRQTTPELRGMVTRVAPDRTTDQRTGAAFYSVRIMISDQELKRFEGLKLVPGMPAQAFVETGRRSLLSFLLKPLGDHFARSFRE